MNLPKPVEPFLSEVWEECDPVRATSGPYYKSSMGLPPKEIRIYEGIDADWDRGFCKPPYTSAWRYVGGRDVEVISPDDLPDYRVKPSGMYWPIGRIDFVIDAQQKRALYNLCLGPRYGRGFRVTFDDVESLVFTTQKGRMIWMS